jgi:ribose 5-phosphate isomerase B
MKIVIGSDHNGFLLKEVLREHLLKAGYEIDDIGVENTEPVDYPDVAERLSNLISTGVYARGILICGTGIGMAMVANKLPGVRAAQVQDIYSAERAAKSNDANVITFGAQVTGAETAKMMAEAWLRSEFAGGRSAPKVEKINALDRKYRASSGE